MAPFFYEIASLLFPVGEKWFLQLSLEFGPLACRHWILSIRCKLMNRIDLHAVTISYARSD